MSVNWGQQLLDFLGVGCCSIRVWWRVLAAQQSWLFFVLLLVSWCSRCFHWWKIRTAGRPVQHLTLLLWSCAPGIGGVVNCVHWQSFLEVFLLQLLVFGTTWFSLLLTCFWYCIVNKIWDLQIFVFFVYIFFKLFLENGFTFKFVQNKKLSD